METPNPNEKAKSRVSNGFFSFSEPNKQGWLTKQGGRVKNWKRRYFILQDNRMYYYKSPKDQDPQGFIPLERCSARFVEVAGKRCLEIFDPRRPFSKNHPTFFIFADTEEEMKEWMSAMKLSEENKVEPDLPVSKEGWLTKRGGIVKSWKKRYFVLRGNYLYYYKHPKDRESLGFIPIDRASVQVVDAKKYGRYFCFEITDPSNAFNKWHKIFALCAVSEEEMNAWIEAISDYSGENDPVGFTSNSRDIPKDRKTRMIKIENIRTSADPIENAHASALTSTTVTTNATLSSEITIHSITTDLSKSENSRRIKTISKVSTLSNIPKKEESSLVTRKLKSNSIESQIFSKKKRIEDANGGKVNLPMFVIKMVAFIDNHELGIGDLSKLSDISPEETEPLRIQLKKEAYSEEKIDEILSRWETSLVMKLLYIYLENIFSTPLIDYEYTHTIMKTKKLSEDARHKILTQIIQEELSEKNRNTLEFLLAFIGRIAERTESYFVHKKQDLEVKPQSLIQIVKLFAYFILRTERQEARYIAKVRRLKSKLRKDTFAVLDNCYVPSSSYSLENWKPTEGIDTRISRPSEDLISTLTDAEIYGETEEDVFVAEIVKKMIKEFDSLFVGYANYFLEANFTRPSFQ